MHRGDELASRRENATRKCFFGAIASVLSIMLVAVAFLLPADDAPRPDHRHVPGVVIAHSPAASGIYIGSPGIPRGPASPRPVIRTTLARHPRGRMKCLTAPRCWPHPTTSHRQTEWATTTQLPDKPSCLRCRQSPAAGAAETHPTQFDVLDAQPNRQIANMPLRGFHAPGSASHRFDGRIGRG